jgi:hypothetical protein
MNDTHEAARAKVAWYSVAAGRGHRRQARELLLIAGISRLRLTPALPKMDAVHRLACNMRVELALGLAIIAIVSVLGVLPPAAHMAMQLQR